MEVRPSPFARRRACAAVCETVEEKTAQRLRVRADPMNLDAEKEAGQQFGRGSVVSSCPRSPCTLQASLLYPRLRDWAFFLLPATESLVSAKVKCSALFEATVISFHAHTAAR